MQHDLVAIDVAAVASARASKADTD